MTRYQACRAIGLDPISAGLVAFVHAVCGAPKGKIAILHMTITYDPEQPYQRGMRVGLEEDK